MERVKDIFYTLATILIIVGALFLLQEDAVGIYLLTAGIVINSIYRGLTLKWEFLKNLQWLETLRGLNILFMIFALIGFYFDWEGKISYLIVAILLDLVLNLKDLSFRKSK